MKTTQVECNSCERMMDCVRVSDGVRTMDLCGRCLERLAANIIDYTVAQGRRNTASHKAMKANETLATWKPKGRLSPGA